MPQRVPPKTKIPTQLWVAFIGLVGVMIITILSSPLLPLLIKQQTPDSTEEAVIVQTSLSDQLTPPLSATNSNEPVAGESTVPFSNPGCSPTVDLGALMQCEVTESGFIGIHTFEATQGDPFYVKVINGGVTVLDPGGQQVIPEYFDSSEIRVTMPASGRYTVSVSTDIGTYWLYVQNMSNPLNTHTLSVGRQISNTISTALQHNAYTFEATADQSVVIVMTPVPVSSPLNLQFIVLSPDGTKLTSGISHGSVESRFTAPITGTYFMLVNDGGYDNTGQYTIVRFQ